MKNYYSTKAAAKQIGVSPSLLRYLVARRLAKARKRGIGRTSPLVFAAKEVARLRREYRLTAV